MIETGIGSGCAIRVDTEVPACLGVAVGLHRDDGVLGTADNAGDIPVRTEAVVDLQRQADDGN